MLTVAGADAGPGLPCTPYVLDRFEPAAEAFETPQRGWALLAKRALDIAVALLLLALTLPVLVVAAAGVKVSSRGPVLFRQERVGRGGRAFGMLKLRTFPVDHVDAEVALPLEACPLRWGRFLRRTSIDELPQLFNVIAGHMSLVGPRPERTTFATELARELPRYADRHRVLPGMTGAAQVQGLVGTTPIHKRVVVDNEYIDKWSLRQDVAILARTVPAVVRKLRS